jgi:eukaryotic-like serine/threonine-protein kinase
MPAMRSGSTVSHYRLLDRLGRGSMGEVWLAEDLHLPRKVAIKLLPPHLTQEPEAVEGLLLEARAAASIDHPAVVTVFEGGFERGIPFLVMQRVEGETLDQRIARGRLPVAEAIELAWQVADALAEVHALGIIHRDLKASNVMLTPRTAKILDFGLARVKGAASRTPSGALVGTPLTMSPELIHGARADARSDLWALGVILYQALTGQPPFQGEGMHILYNILESDPEPPSRLVAEVPRSVDAIVARLLAKQPERRYARAEDLLADLEPCRAIARGPATERPAIPRLAILPFQVEGSGAGAALVGAGILEQLVLELGRLPLLRVASRAEVLPYRDRSVPLRTLARELAADLLLVGELVLTGTRIELDARLARGDGRILWRGRLERESAEPLALAAELAIRVAEALDLAPSPEDRTRLHRPPTRDPEAWSFYLRAREWMDRYSGQETARAEELLRQALVLDSEFALAHAALGEVLVQGELLNPSPADRGATALAHARRALELEPDLVEGHMVCSMVHRMRGETEELRACLERVTAIDPDHPQALEWAARCYMVLGEIARAAAILERLSERRPDRPAPPQYLATCYEMLGRAEDAKQTFRLAIERQTEFVRRHPEDANARALFAIVLVRDGQRDAGLSQTERALALGPADARVQYNAACAFALAGHPERALEVLQLAMARQPWYMALWPARDPDLASLREHPEFVRLFGAKGSEKPAPRQRGTTAASPP